jgi:hypothetical protein
MTAVLNGGGSISCIIHILYTVLLEMPDPTLQLFAKQLDTPPDDLSTLRSAKDNTKDFQSAVEKLYSKEEKASAYKKQTMKLLEQIRQYFLMVHPEMAEQKSDNVK